MSKQDKKQTIKRKTNGKTNRAISITVGVVVVLLIAVLAVVIIKNTAKNDPPAVDTGDTDPVTVVPATESATEEQTTSEPETEPIPEEHFDAAAAFKISRVEGEETPQYVNPLTGEAMESDLSGMRPVAIMINNIRVACPQWGVSDADVLYECLAEGGITRLLMVKLDYPSLDVVGSIRSSRKYYLDLTQCYDAVYVHAGGSEEAYSEIPARKIDHIDGVRTDSRTGVNLSSMCFYRDNWRRNNMGYEHSLMSTGELIVAGIERMNYRTELKDNFAYPMDIIKPGYQIELDGEDATYVKITYRQAHYPEYEYNEETGEYLRYQFQHEKHIDAANDEQLSFRNVIILVMKHTNSGDEKGHINIKTTGEGNGYYFTGGKMVPITWSKATDDGPMVLTDSEGNRLICNRGKTAINVISPSIEDNLVIN